MKAEAAHFAKKAGISLDQATAPEPAPKRQLEGTGEIDEETEDFEAKRRRILEETRDIDADSDGEESDSSEEESDDEDETAELMRELAKIKKEKAEQREKEVSSNTSFLIWTLAVANDGAGTRETSSRARKTRS